MTVYFTAEATTKGGREGHVTSNDLIIDLDLAMPKPNQVSTATNPEQLFAAGYSACYDSALHLAAQRQRLKIESAVTGKVSLLKDESDNGYKIGVVLEVEIQGVSQEQAEELTHAAHQVCPYSKATRGNIDVQIITTAM